MLSIVVSRYGGPEVLEPVERPEPAPSGGEVLIRTLAVGVAFADLQMREGTFPGGPRPPFTPGYDVVGVVETLGEGLDAFRPGDVVAALTVHGSYAEVVRVSAADLVRVPAGVDPAEAVSLVLNYVTAWQLLHRFAQVRPGDRVLVHSAAGGTGTAVLELARLAGARTYGTASRRKHDLLAALMSASAAAR